MSDRQETLAAVQQFLRKEDGPERLLGHAIWESRSFYWRTGKGKMSYDGGERAALAEGCSPQDVVQEALLRTIQGKRRWNREKYPDIFDFLKAVITSITRNLASSGDNHTLRALPEDEDGRVREDRLPAEAPGQDCDAGAEVPDPGPDVVELEPGDADPPEARALRIAEGEEATILENRVFDAISDDPQLLQVYEHLMDGKKPRQIMQAMSLPREEAYRLTQKLRRRLGSVLGVAVNV